MIEKHFTRSFLDTFGLTGNAARFLSERRSCSDDLAGADSVARQGSNIRPIDDEVATVGGIYPLQTLYRFCTSNFEGLGTIVRSVFVFRAITSGFSFAAVLLRRLVLRKEELIIVSKVTRDLEFRGYLL